MSVLEFLFLVQYSLRVILTSISEVSDLFYNAKSFSHNSSSFAVAERGVGYLERKELENTL